jgi:hypothetical protein
MSEVKVNKISPRSGTTVTLGDSGDTFTIPSGATINNQGTATNFGATGSASWTTTVKTNSDSGFTAVAGEGYFVDTTGGAVTVNLPAGTAGAVVAIKDYAGTFATNNCTIDANGSDKIGGYTNDSILATDGIAVTLIFIDSTQGWLVTDDGLQSSADNNPFIQATGGTETTCGNDKIHTFTGPGTFTVCRTAVCAANNLVSYVVVAGGAGGGRDRAGGGGAGGYREVKSPVTPYTASPLDGYPSSPNRITVTATAFPITVGGGGAGGFVSPNTNGSNGSQSIFSTITSAGGGGGMTSNTTSPKGGGSDGGSGGGGGGSNPSPHSPPAGAGNTPPVSPSQGNPGGEGQDGGNSRGAGGGGAGAAAVNASTTPSAAPGGGAGVTSCITGSPVARAGGGGGTGTSPPTGGAGGSGGGGAGGNPAGTAGTVNTGGGGGGSCSTTGAAGGSGVVIIRYKYQ